MKSPAGTVLVRPRRKAGQAKLGRGGTTAVILQKSDIEKLMHLRLREASKQLGLSASTVKKVCRTLGIYNWGKDASSREESQSIFDNTRACAWPTHSHTSEHASCMAPGSGVASDSGLGILLTAPMSSARSYTASAAAAQERADNWTSTRASSSSTVDGGSGADPSEAPNPTPYT